MISCAAKCYKELTIDLSSWNGFKPERRVIGDSKYKQFLKVILILREVEKQLAEEPGWGSFFLVLLGGRNYIMFVC